jgi:hypothetical protein
MASEGTPIEIRLSVTREGAWEFLRKLATDDDFRAQLQQDPGGTLAASGITVSEQALPDTVTLPSLDQMKELARVCAPDLRFEEEGCPQPSGPVFATCLWLAVGFAAAHRSVQPDDPVAS